MLDQPTAQEPRVLADFIAEQELIGAALRDNGLVLRLDLAPEDFCDPAHQRIWDLARSRIGSGEFFSVATVSQAAPEIGRYLSKIADYAGALDHRSCANSVKDFAAKRRLIEAAERLIEEAHAPELSGSEAAARAIGYLSRVSVSAKAKDKHAVIAEIADDIGRQKICHSTGLPELDRVMAGGLYPGKLYGIAARKKVGKTTLLGTVSDNLNSAGIKHLFVAGEMTPQEIERRNIARRRGFNSIQFLKHTRASLDLHHEVSAYLADTPNATIYEPAAGRKTTFDLYRMICNAVVAGARGAIIDYLQLFRPANPRQNFAEHLDELSQGLADLASEHGIFILIAAQLNQQERANVRGGEGLRNAADWYATFSRCIESDEEFEPAARWLEVEDARYCTYGSIGSNTQPGFWIDPHGPHVSETRPPYLLQGAA